MRLVFSIKALNNSGGTERVAAIVSKALADRGHEVHIVSFVGGGEPTFFAFDKRVTLHYLCQGRDPHLFPVRDLRRICKLRSLYRRLQPDAVIIIDAGRSFVNIPAAKGFTTITWEHFNTSVNWHLGHRLSRKLAAKGSDCIVTLTQPDAEVYLNRFKARKALCIYNPVTIDAASPAPLDGHYILGLGRYSYQKGFDLLLRAWSAVKDKQDWKLLLVGSGDRQQELERLRDQLHLGDSVEMQPTTDRVVDLYKRCGIFALSSRFEGLPLVLIEAGAIGLPLVAFDCPTGPSDIVCDGQNGYLVKNGDTAAFARRLQSLINDDATRRQMGAKAAKTTRERFDIQTIMNQWENLLSTLCRKQK